MEINKDDLMALLLAIPEIEQAGLDDVEHLKSGQTNQSYKLITKHEGVWVIRFNGRNVLGVDRKAEDNILKLISPLNISPKVISNNLEHDYLITQFIDEPVWSAKDCQNPELQIKLFEQMKKVHKLSYIEEKNHLKKRLELYLSFSSYQHDYRFMQYYQTCMVQLEHSYFWNTQDKLVHYDLNPNNIIGYENPQIIDWEFAGMGNPLFDLCMFQHYANKPSTEFKAISKLIELMLEIWDNN